MVTELDLELEEGRTLHVYDTGADDAAGRLAVFWHHGTPNIGAPPEPLFPAADRLGLRWVSYDRPGYGGSTPDPGRGVASAASLVSSVTDALGIDRFAVVGHSGGGSHALACGALLSDRLLAVVSMAGLAPFGAEGLDWFAGMAASGVASLRAAAAGRAAKESYEASGADYDPEFTPADQAALSGPWSWLNGVVGSAMADGPGGLIDDDLAYVAPWGADPGKIKSPTLLLHGGRDRVVPSSHSEWLARRCPSAELRLCSDEGHISVLNWSESALEWLRERADQQSDPCKDESVADFR
jgi:pimeloyl-ACP methyl ester carboxylesterase